MKKTSVIVYLMTLLLCLLILGSCATTEEQANATPDWVSGISKRYPGGLYLIGRGHGADMNTAKDRARADVAKSLEVQIQQTTSDVQTFSQKTMGSETQTNASLNISRQIDTQTNKIIQGINISEIWQDPKGDFYALATLSRNQASTALSNEIKLKDDATHLLLKKTKNTDDQLHKATFLDKALVLQLERSELQHTLQAIDRTGQGIATQYPVNKIDTTLNQVLSDIKLRPQPSGSHMQALAPILSGSIAKAGFTESKQNADYTLQGVLDVDNLGNKEGWIWLKGTFSLHLIDNNGSARGTKRWDMKVSARDENVAQRRLLDDIAKKLDTTLRRTIIGFAK